MKTYTFLDLRALVDLLRKSGVPNFLTKPIGVTDPDWITPRILYKTLDRMSGVTVFPVLKIHSYFKMGEHPLLRGPRSHLDPFAITRSLRF